MNAPTNPDKKTPPPARPSFDWRNLIWYLPIWLLMLWFWQDMSGQLMVQTIPYSEFKDYLANGEVADCEVEESEIVGRIVPKEADAAKHQTKASEPSPSNAVASKASQPSPPVSEKKAPAPEKNGTVKEGTEKNSTEKKEPANAKESKKAAPDEAKPKEFMFRTVRIEDPKLVEDLEAGHAQFTGVRPGFLSTLFVSWILPIGIMFLLWTFLSRRFATAGQSLMQIGKSRARLVADKDTGVTFNDVAGCDEAKFELEEVVDFLKNPKRYVALGAKIPKGVLLVGPPGTGKTLLARAVAGEAHVPFFSLSGSDFVEMFVGVGASRVRDLFEQAKKQAPCIVFIDELDAIGRERGVHVGAVNDEREQTLNQLLVEMDGFEANVGVILLAATNRPEVLDRALLRPGRFDRQVIVDAPDLDGREAILKVHVRGVPLADDVDLRKIAQATPGFSGADLANAINEAALLAARRAEQSVHQKDFEDAVEKVVAGPERKSRRLGEQEKRRVAYHETGHALVAAYSEHADPVHKITIVPRGRAALGYTMQLPAEQQFTATRSELVDKIKGLLGGRAAEDVVYGEVSTGAENDLERATNLARQMICMFGMSESIGLVHCGSRRPAYMPMTDELLQRDCSEATAEKIDDEVKKLLDDAYRESKTILETHRDQLDLVVRELLKRESLSGEAFNRLIHHDQPSPPSGSDSSKPVESAS
ncbi:MAG TPA: ATP-dependent zinc metalloprotease FtsH [Pirellulales bacterium]|nr:ATP-dependent zinc metalloprotease FtsH [Pirellulales bacterium]